MPVTVRTISSISSAPLLGKVKNAAFERTTLSQSMNLVGEPAEKWYTAREAQDLQDPHQKTIAVVVDDDSADTAGDIDLGTGKHTIAGWARYGIPHAKTQHVPGEEPEYVKKKRDLITNLPASFKNVGIFAAFKKLQGMARAKYFDEEKDYILELINTSPEFERQGHGSRMMKWGTERADAENAKMFLEATPTGKPMYERHGFKAVEVLRVKLADYGVDGEGDEDGYVVFTIMVREPRGGAELQN
ncbi:hypothetical protein FQN55_003220 [Onygenales sp. PD_40]|nr:hypothetical protein FQN55_003220 [Onygenales sp. PD_40]KAK2790034.1 hypothetical protein FQN53_000689 [Emmonsiellopsis sp. PD_33]KAK2794537.1 hypothetical protein FQN52_008118 [Onygenales sp. PD_12]